MLPTENDKEQNASSTGLVSENEFDLSNYSSNLISHLIEWFRMLLFSFLFWAQIFETMRLNDVWLTMTYWNYIPDLLHIPETWKWFLFKKKKGGQNLRIPVCNDCYLQWFLLLIFFVTSTLSRPSNSLCDFLWKQ